MRTFTACALALIASLTAFASPTVAQDAYPNRPIKILVPIPPGGAPDARPDVAAKVNVSGSLEPLILSPEDFAARIRSDNEKFGKLAKELNIKIK